MRMLICGGLLLGLLSASTTAWSGAGATVTIDNFTFSPNKLSVAKGTEVTWANQDDIPHTIVLGTIGVRSKAVDTDRSFTYRFDKAGTFSYICGLHPQMHGQVIVK